MNTIMQVCFFAISKVLPGDEAIEAIRKSIRDTYGKKGEEVVQKNMQAVDETLAHLFEVKVPDSGHQQDRTAPGISGSAPKFEREVLGTIYAGNGDELPVSAFSVRRHFPHRHCAMGEAQPRARNSCLGFEDLHSVRQVRDGLPACCHPHQGLRQQGTRRRSGHLQVLRRPRQRMGGDEIHHPGRARRLHRMRRLRRYLPGQEQERNAAEGDQHGAAASAARSGKRELGILPQHP